LKDRKKDILMIIFTFNHGIDVVDDKNLLLTVDLNWIHLDNFEIHYDITKNYLIVVEYYDVDNDHSDSDDYFDDNIYRNSMMNLMVKTKN
jgi:hypothetical protein